MLADHAHVRLFGIGVLKTVGEPVRHGVAEHQHVALRHGVALLRRRRLGEILDPLRRLLLERREQIAAEPAAAAESGCCAAAAGGGPPKLKNCADAGPTIPTSSATATASAISGPLSVNMRKKDLGFGMRSVANGIRQWS